VQAPESEIAGSAEPYVEPRSLPPTWGRIGGGVDERSGGGSIMDLPAIQKALAEQGLDGWLLYDLRGSNPIARAVIGFDERQIGTRRWFYLIPRAGEPVALLHVIEPNALAG